MKLRWRLSSNLNGIFRSVVILFLSLFIVIYPCYLSLAQQSDDFKSGIEIISDQKSTAESKVRRLKIFYSNQEINKVDFLKGEDLYEEAKGAFDGVITQLQSDLRKGVTPSQENNTSLKNAVTKSVTFKNYVDEKIYGKPLGGAAVATLLITIIPVVVKAISDIWTTYKNADQQTREKLIGDLDKVKWESFDKIK
jgi:hypothetical protein